MRSSVLVCLLTVVWGFSASAGSGKGDSMTIGEKTVMGVIGQMHARFGAAEKDRYQVGVRQAARLWRSGDGSEEDFVRFCLENFAPGKQALSLLGRLEWITEQLAGHFNQMTLALRRQLDEDRGPLLPVDQLLAGYDPAAHLTEDFFANKLAFVVLLNFPAADLERMLREGKDWSRQRWAEVRLAQQFLHRVPAEVRQEMNRVVTAAGAYIDGYNIRLDRVVDAGGKPLFRKGLRLISHWGLRDELRALYARPDGLSRQRLIQTIMERIIEQQIPRVVIDNPAVAWEPVKNLVDGKPAEREPDTRYRILLDISRVMRRLDPYYPDAPTPIDRAFRLEREMPEQRVVELLERVLQAPVGKEVAALISKRLGRPLEPFDIWYDGFKSRSGVDERALDKLVAERYPTLEAFQQALPGILRGLGFEEKTAAFLAEHIEVDPARGAGHAWGPQMRGGRAHLRTRVPAGGMDYKGFNIAMHEMGHTVEQVFSLYRVDHTLMQGVPNNAFTEGFAFVFQARDLQVLGVEQGDARRWAWRTLDTFWSTREIAGVALVDLGVWHWLLEHPRATPAELRQATMAVARRVWNRHFAPFLGVNDSPLLAIYSHMLAYPLYLSHYPVGFIVEYQLEDYFNQHPLAGEMERMCRQGRLLPDLWMQQAVGKPVSAEPLVDGAARALRELK